MVFWVGGLVSTCVHYRTPLGILRVHVNLPEGDMIFQGQLIIYLQEFCVSHEWNTHTDMLKYMELTTVTTPYRMGPPSYKLVYKPF